MTNSVKSITLNSPWHIAASVIDYNTKIAEKILDETVKPRIKNPFKNFKFPKKLPEMDSTKILVIIGCLVVIAAVGIFAFTKSKSSKNSSGSAVSNVSVLASASIAKDVNVPIRDKNGKEVGQNLKVKFTTADRAKKILFQGRPLSSRQGKAFVVINIEIDNPTKDRLTVRAVDFIRLVASDGKNFAPDIQTDAIKVEPLSSKNTRTIFIIEDSLKKVKFLIGEINGNRETVEITI